MQRDGPGCMGAWSQGKTNTNENTSWVAEGCATQGCFSLLCLCRFLRVGHRSPSAEPVFFPKHLVDVSSPWVQACISLAKGVVPPGVLTVRLARRLFEEGDLRLTPYKSWERSFSGPCQEAGELFVNVRVCWKAGKTKLPCSYAPFPFLFGEPPPNMVNPKTERPNV